MKNQKKKKQKRCQTSSPEVRLDGVGSEMPTADEVAAERASEAAYERELAALMLSEGSDSGSSDSEALLRSALRPLQVEPRAPQPPAAADLLPPLAAALRHAHPRDVRFLDEYALLLEERSEAEIRLVTEELMRSIEDALSTDSEGDAAGGGGVVLAGWLCAAVAWRAPHVPRALPALHAVLQKLSPQQEEELAVALRAALPARELLAASDALRPRPAAARLLRAAAAADPRGALAALLARWPELGAAAQLTELALAGRVLAGGARGEAAGLLAALAPPSVRDGRDPAYLKVSVAVKTLQNLFQDA